MKTKTFKRLLSLLLVVTSVTSIIATESSVAVTALASNAEPAKNSYEIVSPVPSGSSIAPITQPSRLDTLQGKTIALVGGSFSASVTHAVLRDMLEDEFGCKTYYMDEIGKGGTYNPANVSDKAKEFQQKLKDYGVDAAKKKGSCYIYVYAQNGTYKRIKVTVK